MPRVPLTRVMGATLSRAGQSLGQTLSAPTRKMRLNVGKPAPFSVIKTKLILGDKSRGQRLAVGEFRYAGQSLDVGLQGNPWTVPCPSERFAYWLHSFNWLEDMAAVRDINTPLRARFLVDQWIEVYGGFNYFAWKLPILTQRLYQWLTHWAPILDSDSGGDAAQRRRSSAVRQMKYLRQNYAKTPIGLPRFMAALVLALGGARMADKAEGYLDRGLDWLDDEIEVQILPDGGHISRRPSAALSALEGLMVLDGLLEARGIARSKAMGRAIDRLQPMIPFFTHTDGGLCAFNGGGEGEPKRIAKLMKAAALTSRPFGYAPHSGYQRLESGGSVLMVETGGTPKAPFDSEAHLAPLSFELSTEGGRMIVNCGWSPEQPAAWRSAVRATAAHSTLTLNAKSAGKLLEGGYRERLLGPVIEQDCGEVNAQRKEQLTGVWLETNHEGYRAQTGLMHRRRFYMTQDGHDIRGEDGLYLPMGDAPKSREALPFTVRFHLHPNCRATLAQDQKSALIIQGGRTGWRMRTDGGPLSIEPSFYLGHGTKPQKSSQIVIRGKAFADSDGETQSNRVRWSLRLLEARK